MASGMIRDGVPAPDWVTFAQTLSLAGLGAGYSAAQRDVIHPGDDFARIMIWILRNVDSEVDDALGCLIESYAQALHETRRNLTFKQVFKGIQHAASHNPNPLSTDEEARISAALEKFIPFA